VRARRSERGKGREDYTARRKRGDKEVTRRDEQDGGTRRPRMRMEERGCEGGETERERERERTSERANVRRVGEGEGERRKREASRHRHSIA